MSAAVHLRILSERYPNRDAVVSRLASVRAALTLPKGVVHVISDIHGEAEKLKHILNNGSGGLRPLVERLFAGRLRNEEVIELLKFIYYPRETWASRGAELSDAAGRRALLGKLIPAAAEILRVLAAHYDLSSLNERLPAAYAPLFREWIFAPRLRRASDFFTATVDEICAADGELELFRWVARTIRNLFVAELIVAGDFGDRGPRIDVVIDGVMHQPKVAITWGNHDASWMGACLGQPACIATVLRMSVRYGRIAQLEQGYGIPFAPLEELVEAAYADDPAEFFACSGAAFRDELMLRRMQKAIAILQFKLEAQTIDRNPPWGLDHRNLLRRIIPAEKTVEIAGAVYPLRDAHFPTVAWKEPSALSPEEERCLAAFTEAFLHSQILWQQMQYLAQRGGMYLRRDLALIFHGCVPVDADGNFLSLAVQGEEFAGRALFDALETAVQRAFRDKDQACLDLLWYLWCGPLSPVFGKDKIATFENYFLSDKATQKETKNAYFHLINDREFCRRVLREFQTDEERGLIVNGHVPVKIEKGESPLKASGQAVTIDGAFSEVYGDHGYTLVLESDRTFLAQHHHFASIADAVTHGTDIIPTIQIIQEFQPPRTVADTEAGDELREELEALRELLHAYDENRIAQKPA